MFASSQAQVGDNVLIIVESTLEEDDIPSIEHPIEQPAAPPIARPFEESSPRDKGKASVTDTTSRPEAEPKPQVAEEEGFGGYSVFVTDVGLENPRLAKILLKPTILRKDWEVVKRGGFEDIFSSIYPRTLQVRVHIIFKISCHKFLSM